VINLLIIGISRFAEPVTFSSVFPYLPEMIESFGVSKPDIAFWAGFTSAVFSISQCLTAVSWGRLSDRYGRKPIILIGLLNTMITSLMWGFSTSLPVAVAVRFFLGATNGNVGIIRTMVAEMCPCKVCELKKAHSTHDSEDLRKKH
jgi:MFS family permease